MDVRATHTSRSVRDRIIERHENNYDLLVVEVLSPDGAGWEPSHYGVADCFGVWVQCFGVDPDAPDAAKARAKELLGRLNPSQARHNERSL